MVKEQSLNARLERTLQYVNERKTPTTAVKLGNHFGLSKGFAHKCLQELLKRNLVEICSVVSEKTGRVLFAVRSKHGK